MANTSDIKNGLCINHSKDIFYIVSFQHVKPGKGNAFVRTKLKSLTSGKVVDYTFPAGHKIDVVRVERRKYQFLYKDDMGFNFMDNDTYEQVSIDGGMIHNNELLKEGASIEILFHTEKEIPLSAEMPQYVILEITYTEPGHKGNTATNAFKPATVETGAEIRVPMFINQGDMVKISTESGNYMERVKK